MNKDNELSDFFKEIIAEQTSPAKQEELLNELKKKPLNIHYQKKHAPEKLKDNINFLNILADFAKDPFTDKSFFIPEEKQRFVEEYGSPKYKVRNLIWLRFLDKVQKTPPYCIDDYELLFYFLTYVLPIKYAHRVTKCLLDEYKTLEGVLTAPAGELEELLFFKYSKEILIMLDLIYAILHKCSWEAHM